MQMLYKSILVLVMLFLSVSCSLTATKNKLDLNVVAIEAAGIGNMKHPERLIFSSGQPTKEQLKVLSESGIKHVVNLRPVAEQEWDEKKHVESLGLSYHSISVGGHNDLTMGNAQSLRKLLKSFADEPVLVHCSSGNRVGALIAIAESEQVETGAEQAIEEGKRWGLTRLEPVVRSKLFQRK